MFCLGSAFLDIVLSIEDKGSGFPIVFLHAFPLDRTMWTETARAARKSNYRTVLVDLPGFGESPGNIESIPDTAVQVISTLDSIGVDRFILCGLSMGGYVGFNILRLEPRRIHAAIFCDTTSRPDSEEKRTARHSAVQEIGEEGPQNFLEAMLESMVSSETLDHKPDVISDLRNRFNRAGSSAMQAALTAMAARGASSDLLEGIEIPVAYIFGTDDPMYSDGQMMAERTRSSKLVSIPQAGHFSNLESPEKFSSAMLGFLSELSVD